MPALRLGQAFQEIFNLRFRDCRRPTLVLGHSARLREVRHGEAAFALTQKNAAGFLRRRKCFLPQGLRIRFTQLQAFGVLEVLFEDGQGFLRERFQVLILAMFRFVFE